MKNKMLVKIYGELETLVCLPLQKSLGHTESGNQAGWLAAYHKRGFQFANTRAESEALRTLVAEGRLSTRGATQGRTNKMTADGMRAALAIMGLDWADSGKLLSKIIEEQKKSAIKSPYRHHGGAALAMAWHLIPEAGEWLATARKSDGDWKKYIKELCRLQVDLAPLLILDYVALLYDCRGCLWGLMATEQGRAAAGDWPDALALDVDLDLFADSCTEHFFMWEQKYSKEPPLEFRNVCGSPLPASEWASR